MTNPPGYMAAYFAKRRAREQCVACGRPSPRYSRCLQCRFEQRVKEFSESAVASTLSAYTRVLQTPF